MSGSAPLPWFVFSLTLAPELVLERLQGVPVPELPPGELAEALDVGLVYDVPSPDWGGRVARLVEAPGQRVMGLLRAVPSSEWGQVARLEALLGLATGERPVRVRTASGAVRAARAFSPVDPRNPAPGPVSVAFLVALARAAEHAGLPSHHVERLQAEAHLVQTVQRAQADRVR
ncbi:gamma-glutamylcyclotransferase [Stigmatella sp. ncwal1]|uniref:Gamma-glutamylcyclotransferase n=1 Tax=Stigmatella ashevillensis TaxID=2995309 RepID=A0ABT5DFY5_9BACT|nr:gamma-glutamylcyclotransferase [Stigmatella ashevillena]MDC0711271.1 gamma-glutamylcyclotransferase [Stigmatella ashevillena]